MIRLRPALRYWILVFLGATVLFMSLRGCNAPTWQRSTAVTPTSAMDNVMIVGKQVREITSFEGGKKVSHQLTMCNAVATIIDGEVQGIILYPIALVKNGLRESEGRSLPVFRLEVISVDSLEAIDQGVREYWLERIELHIGKPNRLSFDQSLTPRSGKQLAVKLYVDDTAVDNYDQYYVEFRYDQTINSRTAVQTMVIPLYEYQWLVIKGGLDIGYLTVE